jgi:hypothetical protein
MGVINCLITMLAGPPPAASARRDHASGVTAARPPVNPRMTWRLIHRAAMAEQAATAVLSVSGAGGLALGAWTLSWGGVRVAHIGRRTEPSSFGPAWPTSAA